MIEKTFSEHLHEQEVFSNKENKDNFEENISSPIDSLFLSLQEDVLSSYGNRPIFRELPNETKLSIYQKMDLSSRKPKRS
jgi:hypothetical protein